MFRLNSRQWLALLASLVTVMVLVTTANNKYSYSLNDISKMIGSMELSQATGSTSMIKSEAKITNNKSPEMLAKHEIENKVNELLKQRLESELSAERIDLANKLKEMQAKVHDAERAVLEAKKDRDNEIGSLQVNVVRSADEEGPQKYRKHVYSFRTLANDEGKRQWDAAQNELVLLSSITKTFGRGRTYEDFLTLLDEIHTIDHPKTSISLLIGDEEMFQTMDKYINSVFNNIRNTVSISDLAESFSKITLIHAPFLEEKLSLSRNERQKANVQKQRRRVLAEMRNFLVAHGIDNEKYSLFIDSDVIELPKDMLKNFIDSGVDIGTIRIDMKNPEGSVTHPDYDLNAWAGSRIKPNEEEEKKLDEDPEYFFEPRPADDAIHMLDLSSNREKFQLDESPTAKYELKSVGGAVLFAKTNVYRQGAIFPPYYVIGTKWERKEGWDGIETEGLCYIANAIGYKCWGFPNMVGYHTV